MSRAIASLPAARRQRSLCRLAGFALVICRSFFVAHHRRQHRQAAGAAAEAKGLYRPHFRYDLNSGHFAALRLLTSWARARNRFAIARFAGAGAERPVTRSTGLR